MMDSTLRVLFDEATIQKRLDELGREIDACYINEPVVIIGVLKGAFMFFSDLVRRLHCKPVLDFICMSSYGNNMFTEGRINFMKDVTLCLEDKHVLVIEDIVDTGHSMQYLNGHLQKSKARSIRIAALIDKTERREVPVHVDFAGFTVSGGFIVGYGLDYAEQFRELPALYTLEPGSPENK